MHQRKLALEQLRRVNVVGSSGSGKSHLSRQLSSLLEIPYLEMDALFWGPNWSSPSDDEFFPKLRQELAAECWILDGNYNRTLPIKWEAVQTVFWLDYSFARTLFQATKRAFQRARSQEELWPGTGNRESFQNSFFSKDSIILWSVKNYRQVRIKYETILTDESYSHINFVRFNSPKETEKYLDGLREASAKPTQQRA